MAVEFNPIKPKGGAQTQGAFLANKEDDEKRPKFTIAFNQPSGGYVSPPASNIMGFGPAAENA